MTTDDTQFETELRGVAWTCPDHTDSYDILPKEYWSGGADIGSLNEAELGKRAMAGIDDEFATRASAGEFDFIVAGKTFGGGGKSIEHPIIAIRGAGINAVIAEGFARYFYRNAINNRLPVLQCEGILDAVSSGDELSVDLESGTIRNETTDETLTAQKLPDLALDILRSGGGINYAKTKKLPK